MNKTKNPVLTPFFLLVLFVIAPFSGSFVPAAAYASTANCTSENTMLYIAAHEDDSLLFQNPDLLHDIQGGRCVQTVFVTAGDAGAPSAYWLSRESGVKAAYAYMASSSNNWIQADANIPGHPTVLLTLAENSKVSLIFLRLPDGGVDGTGFNGNGSLQQLWDGSASMLATLDGTSVFTRQDLIDALAFVMSNEHPSLINTQDFVGIFGEGDHSDHYATAYFAKRAHQLYTDPHTINAYQGYLSTEQPINVFGDDFTSMVNAFFAYTPFDSSACQTYGECSGLYADWLNRQYIVGSESGGIVDVCSNLDDLQTTMPNGYQLTDGLCVVNPLICQTVVSDTGDVTDASGTPAVVTFSPSTWTAGANIPGASWIWNSYHVSDPFSGGDVTFTKQIDIYGTITSASIVLATDDFYEASINGTQFGASTDIDNYTAGNEDIYDVSSLLHDGQNTLAITVHNIASDTIDPELNPAGLRYKLDIIKNVCGSNSAPVVILNGSNPVNLKVGDLYSEEGATATDAEDGIITATVSGSVDTSVVGTYSLVYTAIDSGGLSATAIRTVNVTPKSGVNTSGTVVIHPKRIKPYKLAINNDDVSTNSIIVNLKIIADSAVIKMAISNTYDFIGVSQEDFSPTKSWVLSADEGVKTVYAILYDQYGVVSDIISDSIILTHKKVLGIKLFKIGNLIRGNDHKIYVVVKDGKRHIRTLQELRKFFFGRVINNVTSDNLDQFSTVN